MGQTSVGRLHGRLDVLQTLLVAPPSWIQDGGAGYDVNQDLGYFFRSLLRGGAKWRPFRFRWPSWMTSFAEPEMRSSKMAAGSGRAAILHLPLNRDRKKYPILLAPIWHKYPRLLTLIPAWISNYIHYKVWDEITYPFLNFNGCTIEV